MSDKQQNYQELLAWLSVTRDEELDCDRFSQLVAPWLDQRITDDRILALLEHHRRLCSECDEEVTLVERALGSRAPSREACRFKSSALAGGQGFVGPPEGRARGLVVGRYEWPVASLFWASGWAPAGMA